MAAFQNGVLDHDAIFWSVGRFAPHTFWPCATSSFLFIMKENIVYFQWILVRCSLSTNHVPVLCLNEVSMTDLDQLCSGTDSPICSK